MDGAFRLVQKTNPKRCFQIHRESFLLGRSQGCDLIIAEPHVSRVQAKVCFENGRHFIKNLGRNAIRINGRPTAGDFLKPGDELILGRTHFVYQDTPQSDGEIASESKTLLASDLPETSAGERLVCTAPSGQTMAHALGGKRIVIGRSQETDIVLDDPSVSRRHCVIEMRDGAYYARNISASNPMAIKDVRVTEKRLYSGDQLQIGPFALVFLSSRLADTQEPAQPQRQRRSAVRIAIILTVLIGAGVTHRLAYVPWQNERMLAAASRLLQTGEAAQAREMLLKLPASDTTAAQQSRVRELLAEATLAITREKAQKGSLEEAVAFLTPHLLQHGNAKESAELRDQLHRYLLDLGRDLETGGNSQQALKHYASIPEDSRYFAEAQKAVHRLWLDSQQKEIQQRTVVQLLKEADGYFGVKRYLTPVHQNAYSLYQAVLALEPQNETALKRIEQIKTYYRSEGEIHFKAGNWPKALAYFERFTLIDPEALDIREKMTLCHRQLVQPEGRGRPSPSEEKAPKPGTAGEQEKIRQMLEESGAESSWIMKYLFQEKAGEKEAETPW